MTIDPLDAEIDANYDHFRRNLAQYLTEHHRRFALLHARQVVGFYDTVTEAASAGHARFAQRPFSVQEVIEEPIDLGFFSHAGR